MTVSKSFPRTAPLVVVGDTMLDVDLDGEAGRLCPDAPVPVVDLRQERQRPGGAGLAALLASQHGQDVLLVTALGGDESGEWLRDMLASYVDIRALPLCGTTVRKTRIRAAGQPVVRVDSGDGRAGASALAGRISDAIRSAAAVLVADYGLGVASDPMVREALTYVGRKVPVVWDPHPRGAVPIRGARLVTPNESEAWRFAGVLPGRLRDIGANAAMLRLRWQADAVAVTRGAQGVVLAEQRVSALPVPPDVQVPPRSDTCGAGDRFSSAATVALLNGQSVADAVAVAVDAASRFVADGGTASFDGLLPIPASVPAKSEAVIDRVRRRGGRVVATGGCFDLLHPGHISLLQQARALGDALVVCVNSDASIRRLKGPGRPINAVSDRVRLLEALEPVDAVVVFDEPSPEAVLRSLRPDVWVKGDDYTEAQLPEAEVVRQYGGEVVFVPIVHGYSTTRLVKAIHGTRSLTSKESKQQNRGVA